MGSFYRKATRFIITIVGTTAAILALMMMIIGLHPVQQYLAHRFSGYLKGHYNIYTKFDNFYVSPTGTLYISNFSIGTQLTDSIFCAKNIQLSFKWHTLIHRQIIIQRVSLQNGIIKLKRLQGDTLFNYQHLLLPLTTHPTNQPANQKQPTKWQLQLGQVQAESFQLDFEDLLDGIKLDLEAKNLEAVWDTQDISGTSIQLKQITISDAQSTYHQFTPSRIIDSTATTSSAFRMEAHQVALNNIHFSYLDEINSFSFQMQLKGAEAQEGKLDLSRQRIDFQKVKLQQADYLQITPEQRSPTLITDVQSSSNLQVKDTNGWKVTIHQTQLFGTRVGYSPGFSTNKNVSNWYLSLVESSLTDLIFHQDRLISVNIQSCHALPETLPIIHQLRGKFTTTPHFSAIELFEAKIGSSEIEATLRSNMSMIEGKASEFYNTPFSINVKQSTIYWQDLQTIWPSLRKDSLASLFLESPFLQITLQASGHFANLTVDHCKISHEKGSYVSLSGKVTSLLNPQQISWNIDQLHLWLGSTETHKLLKQWFLPLAFKLPPYLEIKGKSTGNLHGFQIETVLKSSFIQLAAHGSYKHSLKKHHFQVKVDQAQAYLKELLLENYGLENLAFTAVADWQGHSMDWRTWLGNGKVSISQLDYLGKRFGNIQYKGFFKDAILTGQLYITNSILEANVRSILNFAASSLQATGDIQKIDFRLISGLTSGWKLSTKFNLDVLGFSLDSAQMQLGLNKAILQDSLRQYTLGTINTSIQSSANKSMVQVDTDALYAKFSAEADLKKFVSQLFALPKSFILKDIPFQLTSKLSQLQLPSCHLDMQFRPDTLIQSVLDRFQLNIQNLQANAEWYSSENIIDLKVRSSTIELGQEYQARDFTFQTEGNPDTLMYHVSSATLAIKSLNLKETYIKGYLTPQEIISQIQLKNEVLSDSVQLSFKTTSNGDYLQFSFLPQDQIFINQLLKINPDNVLAFRNDKLYQANLRIEGEGKMLMVETFPQGVFTDHLKVGLDSVDLSHLNRFLPSQMVLAGKLGGSMELVHQLQNSQGTLQLDNLVVSGYPIGNLVLQIYNRLQSTGEYNYGLSLQKDESELIGGKGSYKFGDSLQIIDGELTLQQIDLAILGPLIDSAVQGLSGTVQGVLTLKGSSKSPHVEGYLSCQQVSFRPTFLHTKYYLEGDTILWNKEGIQFKDFTLVDSLGKSLTLTGTINPVSFQEWNSDLYLHSNGIQVLGTTERDNPVFYGYLSAESDIHLTGRINQPVIKGKITITRDMDLKYRMLENLSLQQYEGLIRFVSLAAQKPTRDSISLPQTKSLWNDLEMNVNVNIAEGGNVYFLFNAVPEESIEARGGGAITLTKLPRQDISITGEYLINTGKIVISTVVAAPKELTIQKNSQLTWSGDPYNPTLNVVARKAIRASVSELIGSKNMSAPSLIDVVLRAQNQLQAMNLQFNLETENQEVKYALRQIPPEEIESQAINLLLFEQFVQPNTTHNNDYLAINNRVNEFLTGRLNSLTNQILRNIDLNFNYETYQDVMQGTEKNSLTYQISKKFGHNRAVLRVGGYLAGYNSPTTKDLNNLIGDLVLEYYLKKGSENYLKVFRQTSYEDLLEGEITKSGLGIILHRSYPSLKSIFKRPKQVKRKK